MNEKIFLIINSFAKKSEILDFLGIFCAKSMPYIFIFILSYLYFVQKKKNEVLFATYSATLGIIFSKAISLFYFHNRPFVDNIGVTLINHKPDSSFPSDHTTFLFAIAFSLYFSNVKYSKTLFLLALLGGIARVFVGVHYPYDIVGGILLGLIAAIIIKLFKEKLNKLNQFVIKLL